ncbi:hypothetical protein Syun_001159 [Stephania yunnanensis]|uniref:Uncharacterized protein n=1 Tax=Stephania yunnanensis TaxID=152371 RepID=A0AAP0LHA6_9MAGN
MHFQNIRSSSTWVDDDDDDAEEPTRKKEIASPSTSGNKISLTPLSLSLSLCLGQRPGLEVVGASWEEEGEERKQCRRRGSGWRPRRRRDSARGRSEGQRVGGVVHVAVEEVGVSVASGADGGDVGVEEEIRGGGRSGGGGGGGGGCGGAEVVDGGADCGEWCGRWSGGREGVVGLPAWMDEERQAKEVADRSKEDQPLVLVQPPTFLFTFGTPYKGVEVKERSQIFYTTDTFVLDNPDETNSFALEVPNELLNLKEDVHASLPKYVDAPFVVDISKGEGIT